MTHKKEIESFAVTLAKCHLESEFQDFIVIAVDSRIPNDPKMKIFHQARSPEMLTWLFEKFLEEFEPKNNP